MYNNMPIELVNYIIDFIPFCTFCNVYKTNCARSGSGDMICFECWRNSYKICL